MPNEKRDIYRACAALVVLRPTDVCSPDGCGQVCQILLLRKPRKRDAWQFPQGGIEEGETLEVAALRELKEEAGIEATLFGKSDKFYQYDFPTSYRRFRPDHVGGQRVNFVFATVAPDVQITVDGKEIDAYAWVLPEQMHLYLKRAAYLDLARELVTEGCEKLNPSSSLSS